MTSSCQRNRIESCRSLTLSDLSLLDYVYSLSLFGTPNDTTHHLFTTTMNVLFTRFFFFFLTFWSMTSAALPADSNTKKTAFSSSEQALFGSSYAEDCIFGSTSSLFRMPDDENVVEVKHSTTRKQAANDNDDDKEEAEKSTIPDHKPRGFASKPSFGRRR